MRLEGTIGKSLSILGVAVVLCLNAAGQVSPAGAPSHTPEVQAPVPSGMGGMASYEGLVVQTIAFPDLPSANTPESSTLRIGERFRFAYSSCT